MYVYNAAQESDLSFDIGDELELIGGEEGGWWKARNKRTGDTGLVPSNFIRKKDQEQGNQPKPEKIKKEKKEKKETPSYPMYVALYDYEASNSGDISFKKGEEMEILSMDSDWWLAKVIGPPQREGYVPRLYVAEKEDLTKYPWYKGRISRAEASQMLLSPPNTFGSFLVRDSETSMGFSLSVRRAGEDIQHYRIIQDNDVNYFVTRNQVFSRLNELVEYYMNCDFSPGRLVRPCQEAVDLEYSTTAVSVATPEVSKQSWEIDRTSIVLGKTLGSGQFGEVKQGRWNKQLDVAVKLMKGDSMAIEEFRLEAETMMKLRHPRLVKLYGICTSPAEEPILIVTEFMKGGALLDHLRNRKKNKNLHSNHELVTMGSQVSSGMAYLEKEGIVHRDLAARNVLVEEGGRNAKVADFGLARVMEEDVYERKTFFKMPVKWTAPEALETGEYNTKSDVWSFGILLYELVEHGVIPYAGMSNQEALDKVKLGYRIPKPKTCPNKLYDIMMKCWEADPDDRPDFFEVKVMMEELQKKLKK